MTDKELAQFIQRIAKANQKHDKAQLKKILNKIKNDQKIGKAH